MPNYFAKVCMKVSLCVALSILTMTATHTNFSTLGLGAQTAYAEELSPARLTLNHTMDKVLGILQDPDYANTETRPALRAEIEAEILKIFDATGFSMRTVGPKWRSFSAQQRDAFTEAFSSLLRATYLNNLTGYNGEEIQYTGERFTSKGDKVEIQTVLMLKDKVPVPIAYRMSETNGQWTIYDVVVEGISLVKNYRSQFAELLQNGSAEDLIAQIHAKADALHEKAAKE